MRKLQTVPPNRSADVIVAAAVVVGREREIIAWSSNFATSADFLSRTEMDQKETDSDHDSDYLWLSNKNSVQLCIVLNTFMASAPKGQGG